MAVAYDEFSMFHENAEEYGIEWTGPPVVRRESVALDDGRELSALVWGDAEPELVFLHGGAQNAHTWDTVALALDRPLVAIDLPGHGHSGPGRRSAVNAFDNAVDVAVAVAQLAPEAKAVIGMSLGGMTTVALAGHAPALVRRMVLVDITPGVSTERSRHISDFVNGPASFDSFDELLARTLAFHPSRSESSIRRGILHNAVEQEDGSWVWRYARHRGGLGGGEGAGAGGADSLGFAPLWDVIEHYPGPVLEARGMLAESVVGDDDVAELLRRRPDALVVEFAGSGHSIQGDEPVALAQLIGAFADDELPSS